MNNIEEKLLLVIHRTSSLNFISSQCSVWKQQRLADKRDEIQIKQIDNAICTVFILIKIIDRGIDSVQKVPKGSPKYPTYNEQIQVSDFLTEKFEKNICVFEALSPDFWYHLYVFHSFNQLFALANYSEYQPIYTRKTLVKITA